MAHLPIQVVDLEDNPIRGASLDEVVELGLQHRVVRVIIYNEKGDILLQKRAKHMKMYPGLWDTSSAGYVDLGESYIQAAKRELQEELGIKLNNLELLEKYPIIHDLPEGKYRRFEAVFKASISSSEIIKINPEEVDEVKWFDCGSTKKLVSDSKNKVTYGLNQVYERGLIGK